MSERHHAEGGYLCRDCGKRVSFRHVLAVAAWGGGDPELAAPHNWVESTVCVQCGKPWTDPVHLGVGGERGREEVSHG